MPWLLRILGIFALAVAVALALRINSGHALVFWPPYRIELSLNLLILLVVAAAVLVYLLLRFIFTAVRLPTHVREFRERRRVDLARARLLEAARAYFEGRYGKAEKVGAIAMESGETPALGGVIAARAAHELRHFEQRDAYLTRAAKLAPHDAALRVITQAEILLENRRYQEAINVLKELPEKHTAGLRLELSAQQQAKNWERSLQLLDQLQRRGGIDARQAEQWRSLSYAESLKLQSFDEQALEASWQKIPTHLKPNPRIAAAAARHFMALRLPLRARQIIEQALAAQWDSDLVALYGECAGPDVIRQIERAEQWLTMNSQDAVLLRTLGKLCAQQGLWGKAQTYLEASISVEPSSTAHLALAELFERLGNHEAARDHYRASLELALAQLKESTGGRRKAAS